jgi:hypothetical protein
MTRAWCRHEVPRPMGCRLQGRINRGWNPAYGSILLLPLALVSFASYTSRLLHSPRPSFTAMATELPPSRFKMMGSLASLQRLIGWQVPGLATKLKHGATSLANMRPGDFIFLLAFNGPPAARLAGAPPCHVVPWKIRARLPRWRS